MSKKFFDLSFDEREALALNDPEAFEILAREVIEDFLNTLPEHQQDAGRAIQIELDLYLKDYEADERFNMFLIKFGETFQKFQRVVNGDYSDDSEVEIDFTVDE
jgi:hypothetical protein